MARLVIFDKTVRGIDLPPHPVILGRSQKADIPIRDGILSRKHCTIVPSPNGLRLIDLKSSNGTYLNGDRIERSELKSDDVIEIGNTVIVLLDDSHWKPGAGLGRLRNPEKARKLIETLKKRSSGGRNASRAGEPAAPRVAARRERKPPAARARKLRAAEAAFVGWARDLPAQPIAREILEAYAFHHAVSLAARNSPRLRRQLQEILELVLVPDSFSGTLEGLREGIRKAVRSVLEAPESETPSPNKDEEAP